MVQHSRKIAEMYDAFISYAYRQDRPIAAKLQSAIQTLGKPWWRIRVARVFRDDTSLTAAPALGQALEQCLIEFSLSHPARISILSGIQMVRTGDCCLASLKKH
jgi:hypothetical protein